MPELTGCTPLQAQEMREEIERLRDALFQEQREASQGRRRNPRLHVWYPVDEWTESDGPVLWWHLPVCEPPEVGSGPGAGECNADGTPTACARMIASNWLTHWSRLPNPELMDFAKKPAPSIA